MKCVFGFAISFRGFSFLPLVAFQTSRALANSVTDIPSLSFTLTLSLSRNPARNPEQHSGLHFPTSGGGLRKGGERRGRRVLGAREKKTVFGRGRGFILVCVSLYDLSAYVCNSGAPLHT